MIEAAAQAVQPHSSHIDPFSYVMLELAVLVLLAVVGRWIAGRIHQAPVLGELAIGMVAGNIGCWLGIPFFVLIMNMGDAGQVITEALRANVGIGQIATELARAERVDPALAELFMGPDAKRLVIMGIAVWMFSNLGVLLLMFMVGLGTSVSEMKAVGGRATLVAVVGVLASFAVGYLGTRIALPDSGQEVHLFFGAVLCATSVGISARVFQSLGYEQTREAKIVFGASVIDDVASIVVLAVVVGIVTTGQIEILSVAKILVLASLFLGGLMLFGERFVARIVSRFEVLERAHAKLLVPLVLLFLFAWFANLLQLATITGAFGAGLVIGDRFFDEESGVSIESLMHPLEAVFAPLFFVVMGLQVDLSSLAEPSVLTAALVMTLAAVVGKAAAGWSAGAACDRLTVGLGMIPRGEEALLFASIGIASGVLTGGLFSAVVVMVMLTALLAPLGLERSIVRKRRA